jgi:hypothetical protein
MVMMKRSYINLVLALATSTTLATYPLQATAYCLLPPNQYLSDISGPIPVYLNMNLSRDVQYVGLTATGCGFAYCADTFGVIRDWTKVAIDEINMASHGGPKLYYAGTTSSGPNFDTYPVGITVESFSSCAAQNLTQSGLGPGKANFAAISVDGTKTKARIWMVRGGNAACNGGNDHRPLQNYYWWVDPHNDDNNRNNNHDFVGVLVHEFGHALGLNHTDSNTVPAGCSNPSPAEALTSVMHPHNKDFRRRLRRDDIDGLRHLYGAPERSLVAAKNTTSGATAGGWGSQSSVGSLTINTPPAACDAARADSAFLQVASTNEDDEVFYLLGSPTTIFSSANYVTSAAGGAGVRVRSFDPVAVARGQRLDDNALRVAVAWLGGPDSAAQIESDDLDDPDNRVWWKVYTSSAGWLAPKATGLTKYKELGLSYDPKQDLFLLVYIDTWPFPTDPNVEYPGDSWVFARTIRGSTGNTECIQALTTAEHVLHVGSPACDVRPNQPTQCHIPVVTTKTAGPTLRVLEGTIDEHPTEPVYCWLRDVEPDPPPLTTSEPSYGPLWLAMDGATSNGVALFSHVPGLSTTTPLDDDYAELLVMTRDTDGLLTGTISQTIRMKSDYWPVAVGSLSQTTSPNTVWWAVTGY